MHMLTKIHHYKLDVYSFTKDFRVRWNSTYLMLKRLFKLEKVFKDLTTGAYSIENLKVNV